MATQKVTAADFLQVIRSGGSMCLWNEPGSSFLILKGNGRYISLETSIAGVDQERIAGLLADLAHETGNDLAKSGTK